MEIVIHTDKLAKHYGKGRMIKAVDELDLEVYELASFDPNSYLLSRKLSAHEARLPRFGEIIRRDQNAL